MPIPFVFDSDLLSSLGGEYSEDQKPPLSAVGPPADVDPAPPAKGEELCLRGVFIPLPLPPNGEE